MTVCWSCPPLPSFPAPRACMRALTHPSSLVLPPGGNRLEQERADALAALKAAHAKALGDAEAQRAALAGQLAASERALAEERQARAAVEAQLAALREQLAATGKDANATKVAAMMQGCQLHFEPHAFTCNACYVSFASHKVLCRHWLVPSGWWPNGAQQIHVLPAFPPCAVCHRAFAVCGACPLILHGFMFVFVCRGSLPPPTPTSLHMPARIVACRASWRRG